MTYPYQGRDLFAAPENYFYAKCDGAAFLDDWRSSRARARSRLETEGGYSTEVPRSIQAPGDGFLLSDRLNVIAACYQAKDYDAGDRKIAPLVTKFEVFRRLFAAYAADGRKAANSPAAPMADYIAFGEVLALSAKRGHLGHLSTLLKLTDALTTQPVSRFSKPEAGRLVRLLAAECEIIEGVDRKHAA